MFVCPLLDPIAECVLRSTLSATRSSARQSHGCNKTHTLARESFPSMADCRNAVSCVCFVLAVEARGCDGATVLLHDNVRRRKQHGHRGDDREQREYDQTEPARRRSDGIVRPHEWQRFRAQATLST